VISLFSKSSGSAEKRDGGSEARTPQCSQPR
jgi:hypothetical protein